MDPADSKTFLKSKSTSRTKYEQSRENVETTREVRSPVFVLMLGEYFSFSPVWMNIDN